MVKNLYKENISGLGIDIFTSNEELVGTLYGELIYKLKFDILCIILQIKIVQSINMVICAKY